MVSEVVAVIAEQSHDDIGLKVGLGFGPTIETRRCRYMWLGTDKVFDESYSKEPYPTPIGTGSVVKGWDQGLVGQTVGSRVLLVLPPAEGYGAAGNAQAGIKGTDTIVFVVDVLAAS